jgi:hypothetical protein
MDWLTCRGIGRIQAFIGMFDRENIPLIGVLARDFCLMRRLEKSDMLAIDVGFRSSTQQLIERKNYPPLTGKFFRVFNSSSP